MLLLNLILLIDVTFSTPTPGFSIDARPTEFGWRESVSVFHTRNLENVHPPGHPQIIFFIFVTQSLDSALLVELLLFPSPPRPRVYDAV